VFSERVKHWIKRKKTLQIEGFVSGFKPGTPGKGNGSLVGAVEFSAVDPGTEFFAGEEAALVDYFPPRGWYGVGRKKDVPKDACYVGCHCKTYVWVLPGATNELALFTMGALDLATGKLRTPQETMRQRWRQSAQGGPSRPVAPASPSPRPFNPGLFFLPRS